MSLKSRHNDNHDLVLEVFKHPDISLDKEWGKNTKQNKQANKNQRKKGNPKPIHQTNKNPDKVFLLNISCQKGKLLHLMSPVVCSC